MNNEDSISRDDAIDRMKAGLPCETGCRGGWYPITGSTYMIRVEYAPCPKCSGEAKS